jgi:lipoyl(octanoyl) transferase
MSPGQAGLGGRRRPGQDEPGRGSGRSLGPVTDPVIRRLGLVPYEEAWALQREVHAARVAEQAPDTVLLLEHPPTYTAGKRTEPWERPFDGTPVVDVDRGGKITWHGPGQLTGYPIVKLPPLNPVTAEGREGMVDVVAYVRRLERMLMAVCADLGLDTMPVDGRSGVWTTDGARKVAAIGVRVSRGVTMHGFALNCDPDLTWFDRIVPCGITDATATSLSRELGKPVCVADVLPLVETHLPEVLVPCPV